MTTVVPASNISPEVCELVKLEMPQLSLGVGAVHETCASQFPGSGVSVMSAGQLEMTGASPSMTAISKLQVTLLPALSMAV